MGKTLTRRELYDLVWTKPRTTLAKDLGVSDVWISKQCTRSMVPAPPKGHWARLQNGKPIFKAALPIRLPGQSNFVTLGETPTNRGWRTSEDLDELIVQPIFEEDIDQQVAAAVKAIGRVTACRDLASPHISLGRLLNSEAKHREKFANNGWSFDKPRFDAPVFQRQLRIFNSISHAMGRLYGKQDVFDHEEWIRGQGTTHQLRLKLDFGATHLELQFLEPVGSDAPSRPKGPSATTLRVGSDRDADGIQDWLDEPSNKLENQLGVIVAALLHRAERELRQHAHRHYEWRLEYRKNRLEEIEEAKREAERKRLAAIAARREQIRSEIVACAEQRRAALDIRELVAALGHHPDLTQGPSVLFEAWRDEALSVADHLDPMKRPLAELLASFGRDRP